MATESTGCNFGALAPDFDLATPDGAYHNRDSLMGENGLMVAFICNHCPHVQAVADRLAEDMDTLEGMGIGCAAIMSNDWSAYPEDAPDKMTAFAQAHGLEAPYLVDEDQAVARAFGAVCTPDFFGFDAKGGLQYRGRLDSAGKEGDAAERVPELINAMQLMIDTGRGPEDQKPSMGCSIKWR